MSRARIAVVFVLVLVALGLGLAVWQGWSPLDLRGAPPVVDLARIERGSGRVVTEGTSHYPVRVSQAYAATLLQRRQRTLHIFPLFPLHDTLGREVHVLVLTERDPDRLLGFEDLTVQGRVRHPSSRWLSRGVLDTFREHGYTFADDFVLLIEDPPEERAE